MEIPGLGGKKVGLVMSAGYSGGVRSAALGNDTGFVGRQKIAARLVTALTDTESAGAVLVAPAGYGKTALARHVVDRLEDRTMTVQLRGAAYARDLSYGALTFILAELDGAPMAHPMLVLESFSRLLRAKARGRSVFLVVDNAEEVDGDSATLLRQLVVRGDARVLLLARDFSEAPSAFLHLWQESSLQRFELEPLEQADIGRLASADLDAPLSREAARVLHRHCAGIPRFLKMLCRDHVASGSLRQLNGIWVSTGAACRLSLPTVAAICADLNGLEESAIELARLVAGSGGLPLDRVHRMGRGAELDQLQERGIAGVRHRPLPVVEITDRLVAEALASALDAGHARQLQPAPAQTCPVPAVEDGREAVSQVQAARQLLYQGRFAEASALLQHVEPDDGTPIAIRLLTQALLSEAWAMTRRAADALLLLDEGLPDLPHVSDDDREEIECHRTAAYLLAGAWQHPDGTPRQFGRSPDPGGTWQELADAIMLALAGQHSEAAPLLASVRAQLQENDPYGLERLADAVACYCDVMQGEKALPPGSRGRRTTAAAWLTERMERHFSALTLAASGERDAAAEQFHQQAAMDRVAENSATELLALSASARLTPEGTDRMLDLAMQSQGPFAAVCQLYAKGISAGDPALLLQSAEQAKRIGDLQMARDAAGQAEHIAVQTGDTGVLRKVRRSGRAILREDVGPAVAGTCLDRLTAREQDVARFVVQGHSNRAVAEELGVSTRTVEGHLYQVFAKLLIRSRSELSELLARDEWDTAV